MKKILLNPFEYFSEKSLIIVGTVATIVLSGTSAFFNARFDGVLDLHFSQPTTFFNTLIDNTVNVLVLALLLFALGKFRNTKTRFIDILSASVIARIPYYFVAFFNWNNVILIESEKRLQEFKALQPGSLPTFENTQILILIVFAITALLFLAWYLYLLYQGYKVATNAKGGLEVVLFASTVLIAEVLSKLTIYIIN